MTLAAFQHLIRAASALAGDRRFMVLGSASLLASFPELGEASSALAATYDADLCPEPFDELSPRLFANFRHTLDAGGASTLGPSGSWRKAGPKVPPREWALTQLVGAAGSWGSLSGARTRWDTPPHAA